MFRNVEMTKWEIYFCKIFKVGVYAERRGLFVLLKTKKREDKFLIKINFNFVYKKGEHLNGKEKW